MLSFIKLPNGLWSGTHWTFMLLLFARILFDFIDLDPFVYV